jgi:hypothetical protein
MKVKNVIAGLFAIGLSALNNPISASAHDYWEQDRYRVDYCDTLAYFVSGDDGCYRRFRRNHPLHWSYRTDQFPVMMFNVLQRTSINDKEKITYYQAEGEKYLQQLKNNRTRFAYSLDGREFDVRGVKAVKFFPQNNEVVFILEY